ncbi:membrane protein insertion efficiency factor YidD [Salicibibacter cibi]|uniref:Putative membrane protein insertion efficiency factor n=1 Tax=Salicibibacter cibi TaxID=2743001 RepID=A0A7T6ZB13_9BACI|nr:membrane protein insertion efficiency factor YidD [Salicibibacter cibi]QQK79960.1 membrane protein insertion efficiency factor YidD [Salicibibacter cibi]
MLRKVLIFPIELYRRYISPYTPPSCRFYPTCSQYAVEAIEKQGAFKGILLTVIRVSKCHPFHRGGYDPVPEKKKKD